MKSGVQEKGTRSGIPVAKGYPLVGVLPRFRRDALGTLLSATREYGDAVRINFGPQSFTLFRHPDHVRHILQQNPGNYTKGYDKLRTLLGNGLVLNEGESWLGQRRLMQPAFHRRRLASFAEVMVAETEKMLGRWDTRPSPEQPLNIVREMTMLTQRIIVKTMFGSEVGPEGEKIARSFDTALKGINLRFLLPLWFGKLPVPANRRFEGALTDLDEAVYRIIREHRRGNGQEGADNLLSMLMEARDEDTGEAMSDRQLRDEVMTIYPPATRPLPWPSAGSGTCSRRTLRAPGRCVRKYRVSWGTACQVSSTCHSSSTRGWSWTRPCDSILRPGCSRARRSATTKLVPTMSRPGPRSLSARP